MAACELCAHRSRRRLCPACAEMIARLRQIWLNLDLVARGRLHYLCMEAGNQSAKAAAAAASSTCSVADRASRANEDAQEPPAIRS